MQKRDAEFIRQQREENVYPPQGRAIRRNVKKLRGYEPDTWRYRIGKFRLFYVVDRTESDFYMLTINLRCEAYS